MIEFAFGVVAGVFLTVLWAIIFGSFRVASVSDDAAEVYDLQHRDEYGT